MELKMFNAIVDNMTPELRQPFTRPVVEKILKSLETSVSAAGYTICDLKHTYTAIAQALNWERTEFYTLDELLDELRAGEAAHSNFVDQATVNDGNMAAAFDKLCRLAEQTAPVPMLLDDAIGLLSPDRESPCTHTLLHAGELYREVTILLRTEQLVAWRTADGQEYSAPAHQITLDPDEDGLAAALLTRIAGVEIAPEHMAELRAQMGVAHG